MTSRKKILRFIITCYLDDDARETLCALAYMGGLLLMGVLVGTDYLNPYLALLIVFGYLMLIILRKRNDKEVDTFFP